MRNNAYRVHLHHRAGHIVVRYVLAPNKGAAEAAALPFVHRADLVIAKVVVMRATAAEAHAYLAVKA